MRVTVALRLKNDADEPTLDELAKALKEPARPLFIGRKPCLPSAPLFAGFNGGDTALAALLAWPLGGDTSITNASVRALWPEDEGVADIGSNNTYVLTDQRNWISGLHGGGRLVREGNVARQQFSVDVDGAAPLEKEQRE